MDFCSAAMKYIKNEFTLMKQASIREAAFTLIELLVVIAIIGIIAALSFASFTTSQRQARDTQRKSDLRQYEGALESYANSNSSLYPVLSSATSLTSPNNALCTLLGLANCPVDPNNTGAYQYTYQSDAAGTKYVLWTRLESSSNMWVACSTGKSGTIAYTLWTGLSSPGVCPNF